MLAHGQTVVVKTFFRSRDQDRDLGLQVSRPRQNELESRDHGLEITTAAGCINSNWWQSTRLMVLQITVIVLQAY